MYKLIKIKPTGIRITLADCPEATAMIETGLLMQRDRPDLQLSVVDGDGVTVWPAASSGMM